MKRKIQVRNKKNFVAMKPEKERKSTYVTTTE